jgi:hypothetical protein
VSRACSVPDIVLERVHAKITVGGAVFGTPGHGVFDGYILSFNVNSSRSQPVSSCRCVLSAEIDSLGKVIDNAGPNGPTIKIYGGVNQSETLLFTGYVTSVAQEPHWEDSRKCMLQISAEDVLKVLHKKRFSRRFKIVDEAYAVITGGQHREGGNMTQLKKTELMLALPMASGDNPTKNSPLIKTPSGVYQFNWNTGENSNSPYRFEPRQVYATSGDTLRVKVVDRKSGLTLNAKTLSDIVGENQGCLFCSPYAAEGSNEMCSRATMKIGKKAYPLEVKTGSTDDPTLDFFEFTVTSDYPCQVAFVHPYDGQTAFLEISQVPPHDHRTISRGGPAVGSYDVFQV